MAIERRNEFCKVCRIAFGLTCNGLTPNHLTFGEVYIKKLGLLKSDDFRVKEIIARILKDRKNTPDTLFESLEKGIKTINGGKIFCQIQSLYNPRMCVLLVGKEDDLIKGVVSYIYNIFGGAGFVSQNYSGWSDRDIVIHYKPLFDSYLNRGITIFLRGLENLSQDELKHMAAKIDDQIDGRWGGGRGILIIGTDDIASLPDYFVRQFEIVNLETEKQSIPVDIPKQKPESVMQGETTDILKVKPKKYFAPFPTPEGAKWHEVDISFTDNDHVKIKVRDVVKTLHYSQMGFKHKQTKKAIKPWNTLRIFAMNNGTVSYRTRNIKNGKTVSIKSERLVTQDDVKELKKKLYSEFGIEGNLLPYDEKNAAYKALFQIRDDTEVSKEYSNKVDNSDNSDTETDKIQSDDYDSN